MMTKNFTSYLAAKGFIAQTETSPFNGIPIVNHLGTTVYLVPGLTSGGNDRGTGLRLASMTSGSGAIYVGSGTTAPTENDYTMESVITSGLVQDAMTAKDEVDNGTLMQTVSYTLRNTSDASITIGEVGVFYLVQAASSQGASTYNANVSLVRREVLATPLTIAPTESGVLTIKTSYELPA